jgi:hypothetical protein
MPTQEETTARQSCKESLVRIQQFDPGSLPREEELGRDLSFQEAVPAAKRLLGLYNQISQTVLEDFPQNQLKSLQSQADADYNRLSEILKFSPKQDNAYSVHNNLIQQIEQAYQGSFNALQPMITYSTSKSADFKRLETEARAMLQTITDKAAGLTQQLESDKKISQQILEDIRKVAAEQGVSQQATYFRDAAENHETDAEIWQKRTLWIAVILGVYAILTVGLHKIPWIKPDDLYSAVQLAISKVLIFAVLSYVLYLSTKNYLAQKHNAVINKHRQNALMTYEALADAAKDTSNREIILTHASACIFAPQPTGYTGGQSSEGPVAKSVVELLTSTMGGGK